MIFYPFYVQRWLAATVNLTAVQECMYLRLLNWGYENECALPGELSECCRITRAATRKERDATAQMLAQFFDRTDAGHVQKRLMHELSRFAAGEPARVARREREKVTQARSREVRSRLYALCRRNGIPTEGRMSTEALRARLTDAGIELGELAAPPQPFTYAEKPAEVHSTVDASRSVTGGVTQNVKQSVMQKVMQLETHEPLRDSQRESLAARAREGAATQAGEACRAMRSSGLIATNPSHPTLHALLNAGCTIEHLAIAAAQAVSRGKGFAYALAVAQGQMAEAAGVTDALAERKHAEAATLMQQLAPEIAARPYRPQSA